MKHKSTVVKAEIYNLGYCAEGIGRVLEGENEGKTVFISNTTTGDIVEAETFSHKKNYLRAHLKTILQEGPSRIKPLCPLAKICGGCQWQHIEYNSQLEVKTSVIKDNLNKIAGLSDFQVISAIASPEIWHYRSKVQFPLGETKNSQRLLAGYYKPGTHDIVNIKYCPVQPEPFDKIVNELRELHTTYKMKVYKESDHKGYLRHFVLRKSFYDNSLMATFIINSTIISPFIEQITENLVKKFPEIKGVTVNFNKQKTNVIFGSDSQTVYGNPFITEKINNTFYRISDRSFFQVNPLAARIMFDTIRKIIADTGCHHKLLDVYAGGGAISLYLSDLFESIKAIELDKNACEDARANFNFNNVQNIDIINKSAEEAFKSLENIESYDWIILDPPRSGCDRNVLEQCALSGCDNIIYVSCNPATMARDVKILLEKGYKLSSVVPVDMFCHTYHIESISFLKKND
jgi:23S rRNA (uracil1939-C5)-methyltransferase